ncbi:glutamine amidotransferase [Aquabacterium soli]|uniref:Glutamine amidotransferase n=1 Tax=Aquabacterium soli TaxID=2493092 RepID=A0A426VE96_9BURK|nr:glutamine amidotransferase [Aquabacterium soli]RRS05213.1 glutamine amidotransferase [Aquabacterium soli]
MTAQTSSRLLEGKHVVVVQHLAFEDLGSFASLLDLMGAHVHYRQAGVDILDRDIATADLLIVLGGPIGVYEDLAYPFLTDELAALKGRLQRDAPTLGVCLGAQLIAKALDARVYPGAHKEIGWGELTLTGAGVQSPLRQLAHTPVLHWHGDTFDLPAGAALLASTDLYPNQAFSVGSNVLALQFHPEAETARFERWLIGHTCELGKAGIDIPALRADNLRHGRALEQAGKRMLSDWLDGVRWQ